MYDPRDFEKGNRYGNLTISFQAKQPYHTWFMVIAHPKDEPPTDLFKDLEKVGWEQEIKYAPIKDRQETIYAKDGTAIFNGWTPEEGKVALKDARAVLKKHNIVRVPKIRLTLQDLL